MTACSRTGASATPRNADTTAATWRPALLNTHRIAVAYSGGRDSTALLHATLVAGASFGVQVLALHVHHGLSPNADAWLDHCEAQCRRWRRSGLPIEFAAHLVTAAVLKGQSVEAWARASRYQALASMAHTAGVSSVLLAHHRRDQAETFVLQALRGAGVAGLSAMPRSVVRDGIVWYRPWLDRPRQEIDAYTRRYRLRCIEDESNNDPRFARNRLRLAVWPTLIAAFGDAETGLSAAAEWANEARSLLDEVASIDLAATTDGERLDIDRWASLSLVRRSNALRTWLKMQVGVAAPASLVLRLMRELPLHRSARWPCGVGELRLYRQRLGFEPAGATQTALMSPPSGLERTLRVDRTGVFDLPGWGGSLWVERVEVQGVPLRRLAQIELLQRSGGERFRRTPGGTSRGLKKQYQAEGLPSWSRRGPLIWNDGQLVFVPGLGLDADMVEAQGNDLVVLRWQPFGAVLCDTAGAETSARPERKP